MTSVLILILILIMLGPMIATIMRWVFAVLLIGLVLSHKHEIDVWARRVWARLGEIGRNAGEKFSERRRNAHR